MIQYELIICFTDNSWTTDYVEVCPEHIDSDADVIQSYTEKFQREYKKGDPDLAYVGVYHTEEIELECIGWQPDIKEFPIAGLTVLEVYENLEHGKDCHPEVKNWVEICDSEYATYIIIPYDGENKKKMQFNVCGTCSAKDGRAGNLFGEKGKDLFECRNCHNTRKNGKVFIDTSLSRTKEEIKKTMAILN